MTVSSITPCAGLRDLLHVSPSNGPTFGKQAEFEDGGDPLIEFINHKGAVKDGITPQEEIDGMCVIRREADSAPWPGYAARPRPTRSCPRFALWCASSPTTA